MGERPAMTDAALDIRTSQQEIHAGTAPVSLTKGKGWEQCLCVLKSYRLKDKGCLTHAHGVFLYMDTHKPPAFLLSSMSNRHKKNKSQTIFSAFFQSAPMVLILPQDPDLL